MKSGYLKIFIASALILSAIGCKKDEQSSSVKYMDGYISLPFPEYVSPGQVLKFDVDTLQTLSLQKGDENLKIALVFKKTVGASTQIDTIVNRSGLRVKEEYVFEAPDANGTYKISFVGKALGYSDAQIDVTYDVVRPGINGNASLTNYNIPEDCKFLIDERDGMVYPLTSVGNTLWMRTNLAWEGAGKPCHCDKPAGAVFGRYYTQNEALTACPEGWTLPSEEDWVALAKQFVNGASPCSDIPGLAGYLMENVYFNGKAMWEFWPNIKMTNAASFSALPVGYGSVAEEKYSFRDMGKYAMFWSSERNGSNGGVHYICAQYPDLYYTEFDSKDSAFSVRCVLKED